MSASQKFSDALGFYLGHAPYSPNTSHLWALPICCSQCVLIKVSLGSQHVLASSQCVPQQAPHSSSLYPILLCPKFYSCKLYKWRSHNIFILGLSKAWFKFKFIFCDGPINDAHHKRKKLELGGPHNLINMSHTKLWSQVTLYNGYWWLCESLLFQSFEFMWIEILWLNFKFFFNFLISRKWEKNARNLTCFVKTQNLKVIIERKENQEKSLLKKSTL